MYKCSVNHACLISFSNVGIQGKMEALEKAVSRDLLLKTLEKSKGLN
jgi:hypothetical protein